MLIKFDTMQKEKSFSYYFKNSAIGLFLLFFIFAWFVSYQNLFLAGISINLLQILSSIFGFYEHLIFAFICVAILLLLRQLKIPLPILLVISFSLSLVVIFDRIYYATFYHHLSFSAIEAGTKVTQLWGSVYDEMGTQDFINLAILLLLQIPIARLLAQPKLYFFPLNTNEKHFKYLMLGFFLVASGSFNYFLSNGNLHYNPQLRLAMELLQNQQSQKNTQLAQLNTLSLDKIYQPMYAENSIDSDLSKLQLASNRQSKKKNIVFIVLESIGGLQLFPEGKIDKKISPFLASIKDKTTLFNTIYTYYPATTRSHVPMQTGGLSITYATTKQLQYPYHGPTLVSALKNAGYQSALFSAQTLNFGNLDKFYQQMGFDYYFDPDSKSKKFRKKHKVHSWGIFETAVLPLAMSWIDTKTTAEKPFLLQFFTVSSHHPYGYPGSKKERKKLIRYDRYVKSLHYTDQILKQLWLDLKQRKLLDNTIIYITGDHGQAFSRRHKKNLTHRNYLYEENIASFLLRIDNSQQQQQVIDRAGSSADIMPTIVADATGLARDKKIIGQNLFSKNYQTRLQFFHKHQKPQQWGIRDGKWKFISQQIDTQQAELYDLSIDKGEKNNLAKRYPERIKQYQNRSAQWAAAMQKTFDQQLKENNLLSLSAAELSQPGPKKLRLGLKLVGRFNQQDTFHPDEDIVAQLYRIPDGKSHNYQFTWVSPSGKKIFKKVKVKANWERVYSDLDYDHSMETGKWQLKLSTGEGKSFNKSFLVASTAKLIDPRFRAMGPRKIKFSYRNKNNKLVLATSFHPLEQVIMLTHGVAYFRDTKIDIIWTSPSHQTFKQSITAKAKKTDLIIEANNSMAFEKGLWQVQIKFKKTLLAKTKFKVDDQIALRQSRSIKKQPLKSNYALKKSTQNTLIGIVILDDNVNKAHLQSYGYHRPNTPEIQHLLATDQLLKFTKIYNNNNAEETKTLPMFLPQSVQNTSANSPTLLDLLAQINISSTWIEPINTTLYNRFYASLASQQAILPESNQLIDENKLLTLIRSSINKKMPANQNQASQLFVIHLPRYDKGKCLQHPFSGLLTEGEFGRFANTKALSQAVNCHDNLVLQRDKLLAKIIQLPILQNIPAMVWYGSQYSPHIFEKTGHNKENLSNKVRDLPLLAWFSQSFKQSQEEKISLLEQHKDATYSINGFFNTLAGLFELQTTLYDPTHDLSSSLFEQDRLTSNSVNDKAISVDDETFSKYTQSDNIQQLINNHLDLRLLPHRNNSFGKVSQILNEGLQAFEIDLVFRDEDKNDLFFEVGHDNKTMSSVRLKQMLEFIPPTTKKIWLDIKNITTANIELVLQRLEALDYIFPIKHRAIIESTIEDPLYHIIAQRGFYTSYYLPTIKFTKLSKNKDVKSLNRLAEKIIMQVKKQQLKAISFDSKLYHFVKTKIEPKLEKKLDYHTWDMRLQSRDKQFIPKLYQMDFYYDQRVKTILYAYYTEFTL